LKKIGHPPVAEVVWLNQGGVKNQYLSNDALE